MYQNSNSIDLELSSAQRLTITDADQIGLDITGDISFECWVKLEQLPSVAGSNYCLFAKELSNPYWGWMLDIQTTDKLRFWYSSTGAFPGTDADRNITTSSSAFFVAGDVGAWVHVAITADVSAQLVILYKNGSPVASAGAGSAASIYDTSAALSIGGRNGGSYYLDGKMDDIRIWSDVRTPAEITDNKSLELDGDEANLVAYWRLNNSISDKTSNKNNLTNVNLAAFSTDVPFTGPEVHYEDLFFLL